ncbi:hypothetical protein I79_006719 [Cricetulus griseus]|uniref:Uncharacterized protein n=1 Tax=Cricetulus griseus TaxID=10029 RepID=G3H8L6_CRIGR|nr:hypothetical protein I79_006719 [Cricetulus griseus]
MCLEKVKPESLGKILSNLLSCLQAVQCVPGSQRCKVSPMLGWTLVVQLSVIHFCPSK